MKILRSFSELASARNQITGTFGLVPTMGALHDGHLSLVKQIAKEVDQVIVSIFVNPTQFGPNEDFSKYPRTEEADIAILSPLANYIYLPSLKDIYPSDKPSAKIQITGELNEVLEAKFRPTHFDGVATVVNILLNQTRATHAIFGEKDYQQLLVIKQMVQELSIPTKILSAPILREADGLAMSSRNKYLTAEEHEIAPLLYSSLRAHRGGADPGDLPRLLQSLTILRDDIEAKGFRVQYIEQKWDRLLIAAYLGNIRLIDNITLRD